MGQEIVAVTDESFEREVLGRKGKLVLVDFWAPWCGPCKMVDPHLKEMASTREDVVVAKMNVDDNAAIPAQFGIRSIPTMMLFKDGELVETKVGAQSKAALDKWVASHV